MKKETVSKDPLAEKVEEILTPYPDPMSRNDFRIACHIGTRTSLYLLQSGLVPCKNNGKKTRCYKICLLYTSAASDCPILSLSFPAASDKPRWAEFARCCKLRCCG